MAERIIRIGAWMKSRLFPTVLLIVVATLGISCGGSEDSAPALTKEGVPGELIRMAEAEQQARGVLDSVVAAKGWKSPEALEAIQHEDEIDSSNMARLEEIITQFGWPGKSMVGGDTALCAFLVLQHADLPVQMKYLPMVKAEVQKGEVEPSHLAMLQDRILKRQSLPQIYGTQLWNDPSTGELGLYPVADSINIDLRRDSVGLGPLDDYLRSFGLEPGIIDTETE